MRLTETRGPTFLFVQRAPPTHGKLQAARYPVAMGRLMASEAVRIKLSMWPEAGGTRVYEIMQHSSRPTTTCARDQILGLNLRSYVQRKRLAWAMAKG